MWGVHIFCSVKVTTLENKSLSITGRSLSFHHRMRIRMPLQRIPITRLLRRPHWNCSRCQPRTLAHGQLRSRPYQGYPFPWWIRSRQRALRCSWQGRWRKYLILRATERLLIKSRFFSFSQQNVNATKSLIRTDPLLWELVSNNCVKTLPSPSLVTRSWTMPLKLSSKPKLWTTSKNTFTLFASALTWETKVAVPKARQMKNKRKTSPSPAEKVRVTESFCKYQRNLSTLYFLCSFHSHWKPQNLKEVRRLDEREEQPQDHLRRGQG